MRSLSSIAATRWLTYSLPLSAETQDIERELLKHLLDDRQQMCLGDRLHGGRHFPLGDAIDRVDVVQALGAVEIALMNAVDTHETRTPFGSRSLACADCPRLRRSGLCLHDAPVAVSSAVAQVVEVPHRERAQPLEARIAEDVALAAQHAGRGRSRERAQGAVYLGQQRHIKGRIAPCKSVFGGAVLLDQWLARHPA